MTWIGKLVVLLNTILSLLLGTWAMALYFNRIDWSNNPAKEGNPAGELVRRTNAIEEGWKAIAAAEPGRNSAQKKLLALEKGPPAVDSHGREANRLWYQAELQHLQTGATPENPARKIQLDDKQRPVLDDNLTPRPKMVKAQDLAKKDLLSLEAYNKQEKDFLVALENEQKRIMAAIQQDTELSKLLIGPLGLHQLVVDEREKLEGIQKQLELANRPLTNSLIEKQMLVSRYRQLEARLMELKKARASQLTGTR